MLGTSLGKVAENGYSAIDKTSFGADTSDKSSFFTGKPYVEGLGYAFLFRNYRADMGKWLSQDLIGYPDGWNNFAYCNSFVLCMIDIYGTKEINVVFITDNTISSDYKAFVDSGKFDHVITEVSSPNDFISKIQNVTSNGDKISLLGVSGHANETFTGASTQAGLINPAYNINIERFSQNQIDIIKSVLAPNASYASYGCEVGKNEAGLKQVAEALGIESASGYTGSMPAGPNDQSWIDRIISFFTGGDSWYSTKGLSE